MLENLLTVPSMCHPLDTDSPPPTLGPDTAHRFTGRFATAEIHADHVVLTRDPLGLNKLYAGYAPDGTIVAANHLIDLVHAGIPFADSYAIPPGTVVTIDARHSAHTRRYAAPHAAGRSNRPLAHITAAIDDALAEGMLRLRATRNGRPVVLCLSGGADSSVVAVYAARHLDTPVTAYTYAFVDNQPPDGDDALAARRVARHLGMLLRPVNADAEAILRAVGPALVRGQDWRDFNVHTAIVNTLLARAIAADHPTRPPLVLTGDLMNEFLGDYTPVRHHDVDHYRLPALPPAGLRDALTRGLQTGDREVGVFSPHGLDVVQPYAWAANLLLELPDHLPKPTLSALLAAGDLPDDIVHRPKVRAQIGDHDAQRGILPLLLRAGLDASGLRAAFCREHHIDDPSALRRCVRAGIHRPLPRQR